MHTFAIKHLLSGGLITNYFCSSRCRHCLYGCSPEWNKKYIDSKETIRSIEKILQLGCFSIHIGGGEPFLNSISLRDVINICSGLGMGIEYIETNSSWYNDEGSAAKLLLDLRDHGIHTLLVSISPFHNEYIPFKKVKSVIAACNKSGISVFPWIQDFYPEINSFPENKTHTLAEYCEEYGDRYIHSITSRYWLHPGGRFFKNFKNIFPQNSLDKIIDTDNGCKRLTDTTHFHCDLFGNYIPGLCSGLAIKTEDLGNSLDPEKYPIICSLYHEGVKGLLKKAREEYNFVPEQYYLSKCHLCQEIRKYLVIEHNFHSIELQPAEFYKNI